MPEQMEKLRLLSLVFSLCWEEQKLWWEHEIIGTCPVLTAQFSCPGDPEHWGVNVAFSLEHTKMEQLEFEAGTARRLGCGMLGFKILLWILVFYSPEKSSVWREGAALAGWKICPFDNTSIGINKLQRNQRSFLPPLCLLVDNDGSCAQSGCFWQLSLPLNVWQMEAKHS